MEKASWTAEEIRKFPRLNTLFDLYNKSSLTANFVVDPSIMAEVFGELGFYSTPKETELERKAKAYDRMKEIVESL